MRPGPGTGPATPPQSIRHRPPPRRPTRRGAPLAPPARARFRRAARRATGLRPRRARGFSRTAPPGVGFRRAARPVPSFCPAPDRVRFPARPDRWGHFPYRPAGGVGFRRAAARDAGCRRAAPPCRRVPQCRPTGRRLVPTPSGRGLGLHRAHRAPGPAGSPHRRRLSSCRSDPASALRGPFRPGGGSAVPPGPGVRSRRAARRDVGRRPRWARASAVPPDRARVPLVESLAGHGIRPIRPTGWQPS